ncbi:uncharacterized protein LOC135385228 [Ornithodoros turicata]|uniref:uncharacterized protein LOC135385228 n=1 Tax=Ornithodoros turicata TaxID=34597 RepID=UPI00313A49E9
MDTTLSDLTTNHVVDAEVQTAPCGALCTSCNILHKKVNILTQRVEELTISNKKLSEQLASQNNVNLMPEKQLIFYTGISKARFLALLAAIVVCLPQAQKIPHSAQLLMVLMKLRLALPYQDLAYRFNVHRHTVSSTFKIWIKPLAIRCSHLVKFLSPSVAQSWLAKTERRSSHVCAALWTAQK